MIGLIEVAVLDTGACDWLDRCACNCAWYEFIFMYLCSWTPCTIHNDSCNVAMGYSIPSPHYSFHSLVMFRGVCISSHVSRRMVISSSDTI